MKKFLAILLSTVLVVSMLAVIAPASAASTNVALGKKVVEISGSGEANPNYKGDVTDGKTGAFDWVNPYFGLGQAHVEGGYAWIVIDLGEVYALTSARVHVANLNADGIAKAWDITFSFSENGTDFVGGEAVTMSANTGDEWIEAKFSNKIFARYLKLKAMPSSWFMFDEVEAYADGEASTPVEPEKPSTSEDGTNVAFGKKMTSISGSGEANPNYKGNVTDGKFGAFDWVNPYFGLGQAHVEGGYAWVIIDLGEVYALTSARAHVANLNADGIAKAWDITFSFSENGTDFFGGEAVNMSANTGDEWLEAKFAEKVYARYLKFKGMPSSWLMFDEIEAYADTTAEEPSEEPSEESSEAPVESSEAPVESSEAPVESSETVVESSEAPAESSQEESKKPSTPAAGDASNMLMFAVIALVAIAGSAVVIKTRR